MRYPTIKRGLLSGLIFIILLPALQAQVTMSTVVTGYVRDHDTRDPIPFAKIIFENSPAGTSSGTDGYFKISGTGVLKKLIITSVGYENLEVAVEPGKTQEISVLLQSKTIELGEVQVKAGKPRYRNKGNPAVELINNVIKHKGDNRVEHLDYLAYDKYDKTEFAFSNLSDKLMNSKSLRKLRFVFDNIDTTQLKGVKILPIYMKEKLSEFYYRKSPPENKEIIKADKMVNFDAYINRQGISQYMNYLYQKIDIYDNNVTFVSNVFLSPLAASAPTFYKFFIEDTVEVSGVECYRLLFSPRNKEDMLFEGFLYVVKDSSYAVKKIDMSVNKQINQNWVKDVSIIQEFEKVQNQRWAMKNDEISIDFGITENTMGVFGKRLQVYSNYRINEPIPLTVFKGPEVVMIKGAEDKSSDFWQNNRPTTLSRSESGIYTLTDSIKKVPTFKNTADLLFFLTAGYKDIGPVEIGPLNTFYSYNPIEGFRLRFGGRTTVKFSQKINFDTYLAYGFTDRRYKYFIGATYSLTDSNIYHFPVKSVKISYQDETAIPGQENQFIQEDDVLMSIKRGINDKLFYNQILKIEHLNEFENHFSYRIGLAVKRMGPGGSLAFLPEANDVIVPDNQGIRVTEAFLNLRYAPNEKFYQAKQNRTPITNKYPIINFYYNFGLPLNGSDYTYHNLKLNIYKRFYPGVLGYTDVILEAGKIFGQVPYPLLYMHRANQTYAYQIASYNLMNFLEFVSDQYASLNIDHHFNGFIFNKIPIAKRLKLREVVTAKVLYGKLSDINNPAGNPSLFRFPLDEAGNPITFTLEQKPYIEISAGIENIFKFFRVDVVKRLTYLSNPNVSTLGVRVRYRFDF